MSMTHQDLGALVLAPGAVQQLDAIVRIEEASFSAPWTRKMFEVELSGNPFSRFVTAQLENGPQGSAPREIVGYICFWVVFEELRMMNLAVVSHVRRRGVGASLLQQALSMGREQGARRALLEVRASNHPAIALYERAGFSRSGIRVKYYTHPVEDAILMEREL